MAIFPQLDEDALFLSRTDIDDPLSAYSQHGFFLDDRQWPSVEHYFQAMKFESDSEREAICAAAHPKKARTMGRSRLRSVRKDWKQVRTTVMTRALYIKCKTHEEIAKTLLETGSRMIVESNNYDYYWGCGRDRRGENQYGKVLMNVRAKLLNEQKEAGE